MSVREYTAEVKDNRLLQLPSEFEELHLHPGDKVTVRVEHKKIKPGAEAARPKQLRGRGMLAGVLSSEDFMRRKQEETLLEDRPIR